MKFSVCHKMKIFEWEILLLCVVVLFLSFFYAFSTLTYIDACTKPVGTKKGDVRGASVNNDVSKE